MSGEKVFYQNIQLMVKNLRNLSTSTVLKNDAFTIAVDIDTPTSLPDDLTATIVKFMKVHSC
jgi:hypothetical protein